MEEGEGEDEDEEREPDLGASLASECCSFSFCFFLRDVCVKCEGRAGSTTHELAGRGLETLVVLMRMVVMMVGCRSCRNQLSQTVTLQDSRPESEPIPD